MRHCRCLNEQYQTKWFFLYLGKDCFFYDDTISELLSVWVRIHNLKIKKLNSIILRWKLNYFMRKLIERLMFEKSHPLMNLIHWYRWTTDMQVIRRNIEVQNRNSNDIIEQYFMSLLKIIKRKKKRVDVTLDMPLLKCGF